MKKPRNTQKPLSVSTASDRYLAFPRAALRPNLTFYRFDWLLCFWCMMIVVSFCQWWGETCLRMYIWEKKKRADADKYIKFSSLARRDYAFRNGANLLCAEHAEKTLSGPLARLIPAMPRNCCSQACLWTWELIKSPNARGRKFFSKFEGAQKSFATGLNFAALIALFIFFFFWTQ